MGALVVERAGAGVMVRSADSRVPRPQLTTKITSADDGRVRVFVDHSALGEFDLLDGRVMAELEAQLRPGRLGRMPGIRLLAGRTGLAGSHGQAPLAARLSERLDVEVVAPDGNLLMLPGGELFSLGKAAGWVGFRPGRHEIDSGPRIPGPAWQDELTETLRELPPDARISVVPIPAGLWIRSAGKPARPASDAAFRVPVSSTRPAILVGAPGEEPPDVMALADLVGSLPQRLRETLGLIGCGPEPVATGSWARRIADILRIQINGCHALPQYLSDGTTTWQTLDRSGSHSWRPWVLESTYRPGTPPIPHNYAPPVSGMRETGTGTYSFPNDWVLDVLPSGMLIRPARTPADPVAVRLVHDPDAVNLVVGGPDGPPPARVLESIEQLATALAPEVRSRLRLVTTTHGDPGHLARLGARLNVGVHVLGAAGPGPAVLPHTTSSGEVRFTAGSFGEMDQVTRRLAPVPVRPHVAEPVAGRPEASTHRAQPPERAPVTIGAEGRMWPSGPGWRRNDATATTPAKEKDAATRASDPVATPAVSASVQVPTVASSGTPSAGAKQGERPAVPGGKSDSVAEALSVPAASSIVSPAPRPAPAVPSASAPAAAPAVSQVTMPAAPASAAHRDPATQRLKPVAAGSEDSAVVPVASAVPSISAARVPAGSVSPVTEPEPKVTSTAASSRQESATAVVEAPRPAVTGSSAAPEVVQPGSAPPIAEQEAQSGAAANDVSVAVVTETPSPKAETSDVAVETPPTVVETPTPTGEQAVEQAAEPVADAVRRGRLLRSDHASTEQDRLRFRTSLGWRYDAATQSVSRLLAERPGLRGGAAIDEAMMTELAAIHVFATSDQTEVIEAFRAGDGDQHYPFLSCLAGGLRRLPSVQGLVVRGGPEIAAGIDDYVVGADLLEPATLMGVADAEAPVPGSVEVLIWSATGRRIGGLADGIHASDVMFLPATVFRVLAVETGPASPRVLLTEVGSGRDRSQEAQERHDSKILARLSEVVEKRKDMPAPEFSDEHRARHAVLPGSPAQPFALPENGGVR